MNSLIHPGLWIVATPLGNPGDISSRAVDILSQADIVLAEDTRRSGQLFSQCGITAKKFLSFHDHNEAERLDFVLDALASGKSLALISDAGTPVISDPGFKLVKTCRGRGFFVSVVPGPSAILTALAGSGIAPQPFVFLGFLPRKASEQLKIFGQYLTVSCTLIFFERKDRLAQTLQVAHTCLGRREVCIARELTKSHEEFIFGWLGEGKSAKGEEEFPPQNLLGEITVIIGPPLEQLRTVEKHVLTLAAKVMDEYPGLKLRELAHRGHKMTTGWTLKEIYSLLQLR